jgi:hypothetical protein
MAGVVSATSAAAQVGHEPSKSPFIDMDQRHEIHFFGGFYSAKKDPAKVAPQSGALGGLMYEWRASGPVHLGASFMTVNSKRTILDPAQPAANRDLGTQRDLLYAADAFLALSLTGERSWHHLIPMVGGGFGLVTDGKGADVGGFRFGTRFALPWGAGLRWIPGKGPLQFRADVKDWMYTIKYPQAYYTAAVTGDTAIVSPATPTSRWTNNFALTAGFSFIFR